MRDGAAEIGNGTAAKAGDASSLSAFHSAHPTPSCYVALWQHRRTLRFRVWPKFKMTHDAIVTMKTIEVNGIRINDEGRPEVWHMTNPGECGYIFEMDDRYSNVYSTNNTGSTSPMSALKGRLRRDCLAKWWKVPLGVAIPEDRQSGFVDFIMAWIEREMGK